MIHRDDQIQFESECDHSGVCSDEESELKLWEGECSRMAEDDYTQPKGGGANFHSVMPMVNFRCFAWNSRQI